MTMAVYRTTYNRPLSGYTPAQRISGQMVLSGTDPVAISAKGTFYLELLLVGTGKTVDLKDGDGVTIATGVTSFSQDQSPIRCDKGISIEGEVLIAKGFMVEENL